MGPVEQIDHAVLSQLFVPPEHLKEYFYIHAGITKNQLKFNWTIVKRKHDQEYNYLFSTCLSHRQNL